MELLGRGESEHKVSLGTITRLFAFPAGERLPRQVREINRESVKQLLGSPATPDLGGEILGNIHQMNAHRRQLAELVEAMRASYLSERAKGGSDHPVAVSGRKTVARFERIIERTVKDAAALERAGRQLKDLWRRHDDWPVGEDAMAAAARLALVSHIMGELPLLSCARGQHHSARLDLRVKLLATASRHGELPTVEMEQTRPWRDARLAFEQPLQDIRPHVQD